MSDTAAGTTGTAPRSRVMVGGLVLVLAIALFAAAFVYAGGIEIVTKLLGASTQTASNTTPSTTKPGATASPAAGAAIPTGVNEELAKHMYIEQIESGANIKRLAAGDITSFAVTGAAADKVNGTVNITVNFKDGTKAPGGIALQQDAGTWYVFNIHGMRQTATGGAADTVNAGDAAELEADDSIEEDMAKMGVKTFDKAVLDTLMTEQKANQEVVKGILDGTYKDCAVGAPKAGVGNTTLEIQLTGKKSGKAQITIIKKTIDGKERLFITSFKKL